MAGLLRRLPWAGLFQPFRLICPGLTWNDAQCALALNFVFERGRLAAILRAIPIYENRSRHRPFSRLLRHRLTARRRRHRASRRGHQRVQRGTADDESAPEGGNQEPRRGRGL